MSCWLYFSQYCVYASSSNLPAQKTVRTNRFRTPRRLRRLARDSQGATAIEFAIVIFPFLLVVASIVEVGIMLFSAYTLQNAVQEASRGIRTGQMATTTSDQFKADICGRATILRECTTKIGIYVENAANFTALAAAVVRPDQVGPGASTPFNKGGGGRAVAVFATYDWTFTFPFMSVYNTVPGARRLQGVAVFLNEAF